MARRPRAARGFALLIVLWALVLLAALGSHLASGGRQDAELAVTLRRAAVLDAAVDGATQTAILHLLPTAPDRWGAPSRHTVAIGGVTVSVALDDQSGLVNPNTASARLLQALLVALGEQASTARLLANDIVEWRSRGRRSSRGGEKAQVYAAAGKSYAPPSAPFRDLDELTEVVGMTPELLARLRPNLSLWWDGDPNPAVAPPAVRSALRALRQDTGLLGSAGSGLAVVGVEATADGAAVGRRTVVQISPGASGRAWRIVNSARLE